eukprot:CAMPEP_0174745450 /NCGR_PEP_ID=MMETSP1094-20130205/86825_2 /TAXON_ID=156173 /ORGANISM="Chrysochromulina brevifilum, Strain UTEX LB 985" /LENGTH=74 /DNA_ID=CAMNT_0015949999 /DNA_START=269 /DNA_END=490 /DNA_ORIENTATION=-
MQNAALDASMSMSSLSSPTRRRMTSTSLCAISQPMILFRTSSTLMTASAAQVTGVLPDAVDSSGALLVVAGSAM